MWFMFALASTVIFAFYSILATKLAVQTKNPRIFAIAFNLICGAISLVLTVFELSRFRSVPLSIALLTLLCTFAYGVFARNEFYNARNTEASIRSIFRVIAPLVTTLLGFMVYQEGATWQKLVGITLIVVSNTLAFVEFRKKRSITKEGWKYMLLTYVPLGIAWSIDKTAADYYPIFFYSMIAYVLPAVYNMFFPRTSIGDVIEEIKVMGWKIVLLSATNVVGYYLLVRALIIGDSSKVTFVQATEGVMVIVLGIIFLRERKHIALKIAAGLVALAGILLMRG